MKSLVWLIALLFLQESSAQCNICGTVSQAACISEDQYFSCVNNIPNFSQIFRCPAGSVCNNIAGVCDTVTLTPVCPVCDVCNSPNGYACLSQTTYSPCSGGTSINWPISCPTGMICYPTGTNVNPCTTMTWTQVQRCPTGTEPPVVSSTTPTVPTQGPIISPQRFCWTRNPGYYSNPNDPTCRTYIYCYWYFGMTGVVMGCSPGGTIFNPTTRTCVSPATYTCESIII